MCAPKAPKVQAPPPTPAPPPPPTKVAQKAENKALKSRNTSSKRRGVSALTVRRPSVNTGGGGIGSNVPY